MHTPFVILSENLRKDFGSEICQILWPKEAFMHAFNMVVSQEIAQKLYFES